MIDIRYHIRDIRDTHEFSTACFHVYSLGRVAAIIEELYLHMFGLQVDCTRQHIVIDAVRLKQIQIHLVGIHHRGSIDHAFCYCKDDVFWRWFEPCHRVRHGIFSWSIDITETQSSWIFVRKLNTCRFRFRWFGSMQRDVLTNSWKYVSIEYNYIMWSVNGYISRCCFKSVPLNRCS